MTIQFNCPNCDALIAFGDKNSGKRARCLTCNQLFIIPDKNHEKAKKIATPKEKLYPEPGFYRAVLIDSWKLFFNPQNATKLVFVAAAVSFKFFLGHAMCCIGFISYLVVWGWLFGFYLNVIYETAFDVDELPDIYLGTSITFLWYIIKPFLVFLYTMFIVQLPFIIALSLLKDKGLTPENMWQSHAGFPLLLQILHLSGLFLFPIAILTTAIGADITLLRPDYILPPVLKAFVPYVIVVAFLVAASILEIKTVQYQHADVVTTAGQLCLNLAVQIIAIIAMRSIGLFYRHYRCHLKW